jgi:hypothetical protein
VTALTLKDVFGVNCTQSATVLTIQKSDLVASVSSNNASAQKILAAIVLKAWESYQGNLTDPSGQIVTTPNGVPVTYDNTLYWNFPTVQFGALILGKNKLNTALLINKYTAYTPQ